jgi:hypothetical protein
MKIERQGWIAMQAFFPYLKKHARLDLSSADLRLRHGQTNDTGLAMYWRLRIA